MDAFLVMFREGTECFLIVAITVSYLMQTGRSHLLSAVWAGVCVAMGASGILAFALQDFYQMPLVEGVAAIVAAVMVASLTVYVSINTKKIATNIKRNIDVADEKKGIWKYIAMFLFSLVMITREGFEIALMMSLIGYESSPVPVLIGSLAGILCAVLLGMCWIKYHRLINIGLFLKVTSVFLLMFTLHLLFYGFHELTEVNAIPFIDNNYWHIATEEYAEGMFSELVAYAFATIPFLFIGMAWLKSRKRQVIEAADLAIGV